jgi:dynein heavy chain 2
LDCLSVSFAPVRTEVELLNRKFWDTLVMTLQRSIIHDIEIIEKFATEAMTTLRKQPQSVEEIGLANQKHVYYSEKSPEMLEIFENADKKNKILSAWTKEQMDQVERVTSTWDNYQSLMDNHEMIISKQVDAIKSNLNTQVKNVNGEIDKFKMRWDQMKPKEETLEGDQSKIIQGIL